MKLCLEDFLSCALAVIISNLLRRVASSLRSPSPLHGRCEDT